MYIDEMQKGGTRDGTVPLTAYLLLVLLIIPHNCVAPIIDQLPYIKQLRIGSGASFCLEWIRVKGRWPFDFFIYTAYTLFIISRAI